MSAQSTNQSRSVAWKFGASVVAIAVAGVSAPALAQPADAADAAPSVSPSASSLDTTEREIIVTGSRIARRDFEANSPTVTLDETFLQQSSTAALENQLNKLPQFVVSQSATAKNNEGGLVPAGGDIQPNSTNTPGAATVSLRGVGANRTLVLIDSRRGTPGNASGTVDISTIPTSAIQRVEVVSGGASATYGADAVAGVTNFILKKDLQGLELDAQQSFSQYGDGMEYQLSGIVGADFDDGRGNVTLALSTNVREAAYERSRPWFRRQWANPDATGNAFFIPRPGIALQAQPSNADTVIPLPPPAPPFIIPGCAGGPAGPAGCIVTSAFPGANPPVPNDTTNIWANSDGTIWTGDTYASRGGAVFFKPSIFPPDAFHQYGLTSQGFIKANVTNNELSVPLTRYSAFARGNYEVTDWVGVFGQFLFNQSSTFTRQAPGNITQGWDVNVPWGSGTYTGNSVTPSSVLADGVTTNPAFTARYGAILPCANNPTGGCTNTQAFQQVIPAAIQTLLNGRTDPNAPVQLRAEFPDSRETSTDVMTYNIVAGLEGLIPGTDWTWDISVNRGLSQTTSRTTGTYSLERSRAVIGSPNFGQNFSATGNAASNFFGASTGTCGSGFDFFNTLGRANSISDDCAQAIRADLSNKGTMVQTIFEANLQGGLFELPYGDLRFAIGAGTRKQHYTFFNDGLLQKDRSFLDQAIGIYPSGDTDGAITAKEAYGELLVPLLGNLPFVKNLNLEIGGRISDYNTTGVSYTYKILGDWEVTDWLRFRGGFNRAERAPNIAELFLSPQQTFGFDSVGDLCVNQAAQTNPSSANPAVNSGGAAGALDVRGVCEQLMIQASGGVTPAPGPDGRPNLNFYNSAAVFQGIFGAPGGFSFGSVAGNRVYQAEFDSSVADLKPEVANTWTAGVVINSPGSGLLSRLQLSVDYFNIVIKDPIGALSAGGLQQLCVDPNYNPLVVGAGTSVAQAQAAAAAPACQLISRNDDTGFFGSTLNTAAITTTYRNDGIVKLSGIDAALNWSVPAGPGQLFASVTGNYMFDFKAKELDPNPLIDYAGTTGTGIKGLNFGNAFRWRTFSTLGYSYQGASLSLQWQHLPKTRGYSQAADLTASVPEYDLFNLNGSYQINSIVGFRFGIDNLFNKAPPLTGIDTDLSNNQPGSLSCGIGCGFSFFTDTVGRRFTIGASAKF